MMKSLSLLLLTAAVAAATDCDNLEGPYAYSHPGAWGDALPTSGGRNGNTELRDAAVTLEGCQATCNLYSRLYGICKAFIWDKPAGDNSGTATCYTMHDLPATVSADEAAGTQAWIKYCDRPSSAPPATPAGSVPVLHTTQKDAGNDGHYFYFGVAAWNDLMAIGGDAYDIQLLTEIPEPGGSYVIVNQIRAGVVIWSGYVVVWNNEYGVQGRRYEDDAAGQWQAGDSLELPATASPTDSPTGSPTDAPTDGAAGNEASASEAVLAGSMTLADGAACVRNSGGIKKQGGDETATYTFTVSGGSDVDITVEVEVKAPSKQKDSFLVQIDDDDAFTWHISDRGNSFVWSTVAAKNNGDTKTFTVAPGTHTLTLIRREKGVCFQNVRLSPSDSVSFVRGVTGAPTASPTDSPTASPTRKTETFCATTVYEDEYPKCRKHIAWLKKEYKDVTQSEMYKDSISDSSDELLECSVMYYTATIDFHEPYCGDGEEDGMYCGQRAPFCPQPDSMPTGWENGPPSNFDGRETCHGPDGPGDFGDDWQNCEAAIQEYSRHPSDLKYSDFGPRWMMYWDFSGASPGNGHKYKKGYFDSPYDRGSRCHLQFYLSLKDAPVCPLIDATHADPNSYGHVGTPDVGESGGKCTCPNGDWYWVGENVVEDPCDAVWSSKPNGHSCGAHITWVYKRAPDGRYEQKGDLAASRLYVANKYPDVCGACAAAPTECTSIACGGMGQPGVCMDKHGNCPQGDADCPDGWSEYNAYDAATNPQGDGKYPSGSGVELEGMSATCGGTFAPTTPSPTWSPTKAPTAPTESPTMILPEEDDGSENLWEYVGSQRDAWGRRVGTWGGTCTCPDGKMYPVGDNWDSCQSLACIGGQASPCWCDPRHNTCGTDGLTQPPTWAMVTDTDGSVVSIQDGPRPYPMPPYVTDGFSPKAANYRVTCAFWVDAGGIAPCNVANLAELTTALGNGQCQFIILGDNTYAPSAPDSNGRQNRATIGNDATVTGIVDNDSGLNIVRTVIMEAENKCVGTSCSVIFDASGSPDMRMFYVDTPGRVYFRGIEIRGGSLLSGAVGGAVLVAEGRMMLEECYVHSSADCMVVVNKYESDSPAAGYGGQPWSAYGELKNSIVGSACNYGTDASTLKVCGGGVASTTGSYEDSAACATSAPTAANFETFNIATFAPTVSPTTLSPTDSPTASPTMAPVDCVVTNYGAWSACSADCAGGTQTRYRSITVNAAHGGIPCPNENEESQTCNTQACPIDCQVSGFSAWSTCSADCGTGSRTRTQTITVAAAHGGDACPALSETESCNTQACPIDCEVSGFSAWSTCSATCGTGSRTRTQTITVAAAHGGTACPALSQTGACNTHACPVNCVQSAWSGWSSCSTTCGGGTKTRSRTTTQAALHGGTPCLESSETTDCNNHECPIDCQVSNWGGWSGCSESCGGGSRIRYRSITQAAAHGGDACPTDLEQIQTCNTNECPTKCHCHNNNCAAQDIVLGNYGVSSCKDYCEAAVGTEECTHMGGNTYGFDCQVSSWSGWSSCSKSCGGGTQSRSRSVDIPAAGAGAACPAGSESRACNTGCCAVDAQVSGWSGWSACTGACGAGSQTRTRTCTAPSCGGAPCPALSESRSCNSACNCEVSGWSGWSGCSATCDGGSQSRSRSITQNAAHGGSACPTLSQSQNCNTHACPIPLSFPMKCFYEQRGGGSTYQKGVMLCGVDEAEPASIVTNGMFAYDKWWNRLQNYGCGGSVIMSISEAQACLANSCTNAADFTIAANSVSGPNEASCTATPAPTPPPGCLGQPDWNSCMGMCVAQMNPNPAFCMGGPCSTCTDIPPPPTPAPTPAPPSGCLGHGNYGNCMGQCTAQINPNPAWCHGGPCSTCTDIPPPATPAPTNPPPAGNPNCLNMPNFDGCMGLCMHSINPNPQFCAMAGPCTNCPR